MTSPRISRSALLEAFLNALTVHNLKDIDNLNDSIFKNIGKQFSFKWGVQHDWLKKIWKTNHENIRSEVLALYHKSQQESLGGELVVFSNKPNEDEATCLASTCCICKLKKYLTRENATMVKSHKVEEKLQNGYLKLYGVQLGVPLLNKSIHSVCYRKLLYHASRITSANTSTGSLKRAASQPVPATSQSIPFSNECRNLICSHNLHEDRSLLASSANITDDSPPTSLAKPVDHHILHSVSAPVKKQIGTKSTIRRILTARLPFLSTSKKERLSPIADANHEKKERCSSSIQSESTISFGPSIKLPAESISSSSSILSSEHLAYRELTQQSSLDVSLLRMGDSIISNRLFEAIPEDVTQFAFCSSTPITPRRSMREKHDQVTDIESTIMMNTAQSVMHGTEKSAFDELCDWLITLLNTGSLVSVRTIQETYKKILNDRDGKKIDHSSTRALYICRRLENRFRDQLHFETSSDKEGTLVGFKDVSFYMKLSLLKYKGQEPYSVFEAPKRNEENEDIQSIFNSIRLLRASIQDGMQQLKLLKSEQLLYLTSDDYWSTIPLLMRNFIGLLTSNKRDFFRLYSSTDLLTSDLFEKSSKWLKISSLCYDILNCSDDHHLSPKHYLLGNELLQHGRSANLLSIFNRYGHTRSYQTITKLHDETARREGDGYRLPTHIHPDYFIIKCVDNFDLNRDTVDGTGSFHFINQILIQDPSNIIQERTESKQMSDTMNQTSRPN